ncbi:angiotensin-converting enzyme [Diachasma alloeum]|uniref:angiotensin-converting enzyme n=1 Tax=Diachasma alloeum TaxID=454923 RepID=UPI00073819E9|nr:angiotensin-converting enzyme [Diachasma alloeum]
MTFSFSMVVFIILTLTSRIISNGLAAAVQDKVSITTYTNNSILLARATQLLNKIDGEYGQWNNKLTLASWEYASNLTDANLEKQLNVSAQFANYVRQMTMEINDFPWHTIEDKKIKRQFKKLSSPGASALSKDKYAEYSEITSRMENIYATAKICDFENPFNCNLALEPNLTEILIKSRNPDELKYVWKAWRDASGKKMKNYFIRYVQLSNEIAKLNNYTDMSAYWLKDYEADDFTEHIEALWQQLKPLYLEIHAYIRHALRLKYGEDLVPRDKPIPAHLFGNMWAQSWANIADMATPCPGKQLPDVSDAMVEQGLNATGIFRIAEDFFTSVNLSAMPDKFWKNSILEKPDNVELVCHASAWDFYDGKDFRIKQCTRINMEDLLTAHHEMGHVQYFLQYKNQPTVYKEGANPGFHEAVGDTIALSASTPEHFKKIGLLEQDASTDKDALLNHLYITGLEKIVFLPFAYMMDKWRWGVFQSHILPDTYNCQWWNLAEEFQGITPPVPRSEQDFDPGAKYHIIANVEYIRYFVSHVIQFQFHKALCIHAGQYNPSNITAKSLSECNIYGNVKAGNLYRSMLELGSSVPWQDAMEKMTGQRKMDASGLLEYFRPLQMWLEAENKKNGEHIGWTTSNKICTAKH